MENNEMETRIAKLEEKVANMYADNKVFSNTVDNLNKAIAKLESTLDGLDRLFITFSTVQLAHDKDIEKLKVKMDANDQEHEINFLKLIKDNAVSIVILIFLILQQVGLLKP